MISKSFFFLLTRPLGGSVKKKLYSLFFNLRSLHICRNCVSHRFILFFYVSVPTTYVLNHKRIINIQDSFVHFFLNSVNLTMKYERQLSGYIIYNKEKTDYSVK